MSLLVVSLPSHQYRQHKFLQVGVIVMRASFTKFSVGEDSFRFSKCKIRVWTRFEAGKGRGLILLLHRHWWTRGTKMPVPGAGKQTDIRHSSGGSSGRIYRNPSLNQPFWTTFFRCVSCACLCCVCCESTSRNLLEVYFFGEHQELVLSCFFS